MNFKPVLRNIVAVIVGWFLGSTVNMSLVKLGHEMYPIEGVDMNNMEALAEAMPHLGLEHFIFPFLAHALGSLVGAIVAGIIAQNHKMKFALSIGALFFIGGVLMVFILPTPTWFIVSDLALAYFPMGWLGGLVALKLSKKAVA